MSQAQFDVARSITAGLNYLVQEADNAGAHQISRLLALCLRDICLVVEGQEIEVSHRPVMANTDLFMAIRFLSRYASIKDHQLRQEILDELEKLEGSDLRSLRTDA